MSSFPKFQILPTEIRHMIWRFTIPSPGINFFNVHSFPHDHLYCSRSISPPWCYLDLRRLDIEDDDDDVSRYDPSSWQARNAVRQSCSEAREICAIPEDRSAFITLTIPRRGLFVHAADGQLRQTALERPKPGSEPDPEQPPSSEPHQPSSLNPEPTMHRRIQVDVSEMLVLSVENCSFNMIYEETPRSLVSSPLSLSLEDITQAVDDSLEDGWSYDPKITPYLPRTISPYRLAVSLTRCTPTVLRLIQDALLGLLYGHMPNFGECFFHEELLLLLDFVTHDKEKDNKDEHVEEEEDEEDVDVFHDRFGDSYIRQNWQRCHAGFNIDPPHVMYCLVKVEPASNNVRERYLRSAILRSPKRLAASS